MLKQINVVRQMSQYDDYVIEVPDSWNDERIRRAITEDLNEGNMDLTCSQDDYDDWNIHVENVEDDEYAEPDFVYEEEKAARGRTMKREELEALTIHELHEAYAKVVGGGKWN